jgi:hypothetical protein
MSGVVLIILAVVALTAIVLVILGAVIFGIHADERHMSLSEPPRSLSGIIARRILGAHAYQIHEIQRTRARSRR